MNLEAKSSKGELAYSPKVLEVRLDNRFPNMINKFPQDDFEDAEQEASEHEAEVEQMLKEPKSSIETQAEKSLVKKRKPNGRRQVQIERQ